MKTVLRFTPSERWLHNLVMFTFVLLLTTGLAMIYFNLRGEHEDAREFLVMVHEILGLIFVIGPPIFFVTGRKAWKENFSEVIHFTKADFKWLMEQPLGVIKEIKHAPAGKFNAGQKIWISIALGGSVVLALTGIYIWIVDSPILSLFIHSGVTFLMVPALLGHMYMALVNKETRPGITSIIDGEVDVRWAKEHHGLWLDKMAQERVMQKINPDMEHDPEDPPTNI